MICYPNMKAGREAGVVPIGVATGVFTAGQLMSAGAHTVVPSLKDADDILKAFEHGASAVMIAACETDRCHIGGTGNEIAQVQVDVTRDILNAIGWKGERVDMFRMFSAEPERFTTAINEMVKRAKKFGPTPVHKGTAGKWMEVTE